MSRKSIHVQPNEKAGTLKKSDSGRTAGEYSTKRGGTTALSKQTKKRLASAQKRAELWRQWAAGHKSNGQGLSDEAISRESIYGERG